MQEITNDDAKKASQAWRRRPRRFAPKSRLGCKTCKIRRIKCDLSQPSCFKCQSTGRTCDGYGEMPLAVQTQMKPMHQRSEDANRADGCDRFLPHTTTGAYQRRQWQAEHHSHISRSLGSFMILPATASAQAEAMRFFEYMSIKHLNAYRHCDPWRKTLMYFSQTTPSVRNAAIALALCHRNFLDRDSGYRVHHSRSLIGDRLPDSAPLFYYNRAIQLLLNHKDGDSTEETAITLLVCYLFTCYDHLAGNYVQAMQHLRGGVELSRNIDKAILGDTSTTDGSQPSGIRTLIGQVTGQIRRLDVQAVTFLVDWTPADIQEPMTIHPPPSGDTFQSLDQAADHLQILVAQVMRLRNTEQQLSPVGNMPPPPAPLKDVVLGQLETWASLFENMLRRDGTFYETDAETYPLVSLLRLQRTAAWTFLIGYGPGREMDYDNFLPQFQQCVALAVKVAAAYQRYSGSLEPTFTPEIGIIPALYIIGVKCRHPVVRRQVLGILRRRPTREAVWDSISAARVIERVIEIEEGGPAGGEMIQGMEQIAVWQRVEALSWVHVGSGEGAARLDITYSFCAREGFHHESVVI